MRMSRSIGGWGVTAQATPTGKSCFVFVFALRACVRAWRDARSVWYLGMSLFLLLLLLLLRPARLFEKKSDSNSSFLKKSNKKALCEKFFTVFVEPLVFSCVFLLFENAARKKCFYTWSSRVFFHLNTLVGSKKLFCWLIFVHVFTLTISLKGALFTCTYESNQSIEWTNRINEWKQWIEALNRTNESNQWIESLSRETRQEAVTIHIRWLSKPVLESHHIDLLLWIPNPFLLGFFAGIIFPIEPPQIVSSTL